MTVIATSTSAYFDRSVQDMASLRVQAEALQKQLGSGEKLSRSSDNPVAASRLRGLTRADRLSAIDTTNAGHAAADLQLADSALSSFADYIIRAQELTTQAANTVLSPAQRAGIGTELLAIRGNLVALANSRDAAGHALFGGETAGSAYTLDASGNASYTGTAAAGELALGDGQSVKRSLTGPEFLNFTGAGGPTDLLAMIKSLGEALQGAAADPVTAARDALGALGDALDAVTTGQTQVGARLAWIDLTTERRTMLSEMNAGEEAEVGATDMAATIARLQQTMLVLEASQASFTKLANLSLFDLIR